MVLLAPAAIFGGVKLAFAYARGHAPKRPAEAPETFVKWMIPRLFSAVLRRGAILDSPKPPQYGPRGLGTAGVFRSSLRVVGVESMADGTHDKDELKRQADEAALSARLQSLGERLRQNQAVRHPENSASPSADPSALARGFRLSTELVAGVLVGAFIGWLLDRWLGISPWGLIVFLLFGFAAGVLNVIRAAGAGQSSGKPGRS